MTTYAVLSCTASHDYSFFAPITCRLWKEIVGYDALCYWVRSDDNISSRDWFVIDTCEQFVRHVPILHPSAIVPVQHFAQVCRLFACTGLDDEDDDILMTADVDMWPLQRDYFQIMDPDKLNLYGSNCYDGDRNPICYVAAKARKWRAMFSLDNLDMAQALSEVDWNPSRLWDTDEDMLEQAIVRQGGKAACACRTRPGSRHGYMGQRIDRARWIYDGPEPDLVDAHLPRPGYGSETWGRIRRLIEDYCPSILSWADDYRLRYLSVFEK